MEDVIIEENNSKTEDEVNKNNESSEDDVLREEIIDNYIKKTRTFHYTNRSRSSTK